MRYYEFHYKEKRARGAFVYDVNFGLFFISEVQQSKLLRYEEVNLSIENDYVLCLPNQQTNNCRVHRVNNKDGTYVYIFSMLSDIADVEYVTLDELAASSDFIFNVSDVLSYLADLCILPNGNYIVGSVQDYITAIEDLQNKYPDKETFYRGKYKSDFNMVPSLFRKKKFVDNEQQMYMEFKTQFYNELSNKKYIEILTTMQHYKMPTRLLDTTLNPLVALFMACDRPVGIKTKAYNIGEVAVMNEDRKNVKYSDSNSVTIISSLAVLESKYKYELYDKIVESIEKNDPEIYKNTISYKRFVAEIVSTLPSFNEEFFDPLTLLKPVHVKVGMINERIIAQSGAFILFGLGDYKNGYDITLHTMTKERIFVVNAEAIKNQLAMLNISSATMYPDKDHMSATITRIYDR